MFDQLSCPIGSRTFFAMPHYLCPKCRSISHYLGTETLTDSNGNVTGEITVPFCSDCGIRLGEKDIAPEEVQQTIEEENEKEFKRAKKIEKFVEDVEQVGKPKSGIGCFGLVLILAFQLWLGYTFIVDESDWWWIAVCALGIFFTSIEILKYLFKEESESIISSLEEYGEEKIVDGVFVGEVRSGKPSTPDSTEKKERSSNKPNPSKSSDKCPQCDGKLMVTPKGTVQCMKCSYSG